MIHSSKNNVRSFLRHTFYVLLLTSFLAPAPALAHKVQMFAHAEGDRVFVEGYFPDGKKTINSEVIVYDGKSGEELLRGKTDDKGKFSFKPPRKTDLRIALNASLGHKTEYILPGGDLADAGGNKARSSAATASTSGDTGFTKRAENQQDKSSLALSPSDSLRVNSAKDVTSIDDRRGLLTPSDPSEVQTMVERGVEKGVSPLLREFSECKEHVFFSEIIGGIGYIFGVLGIVLYFKSRKSQQ